MTVLETTVKVITPRRRAVAYLDEYTAATHNLEQGYKDCYVIGLSTLADGPRTEPVFVCEFPNGTVVNVFTEWIKFKDTEEVTKMEEGGTDE